MPATRVPLRRYGLVAMHEGRLELFDLRGRCLQRTRVDRGSGAFTASLGTGREAPGLYLIRLSDGVQIATTKAAIVK